IFTAIYQANINGELTALLPDTLMTPEIWQEKLTNINHELIEAKSGLAATVTSILQLAYLEWQQGKRPRWSQALPFYGQSPV
ncbi:MAG: tRNA (adenosine(37)-N6)-threonylcarbamoyltransferase complex dimerization subunit type 1 TsaB, partial [Calothrix sp. SM1_7_51]|nr:tRNA (adenosine(37)-N6)-threonylcarbamoyltransferase complex dimerization subunit type 1 TsaB [Calothrix sp. SM1_7_51]